MKFRGWPEEAIGFFEGLEADNSKSYWEQNKAVYEQAVRAPMDALLGELGAEFGEGKVFRPYRDVRFSKDKTPYKTNIAATLAKGGYLSFSADGLGVGCGLYRPASDQLERYRDAVADDRSGSALEEVVATARRKGIEVAGHEALKTTPKGYPRDHPRIDLLRQKGLVAWKQWPPGSWLGTASAKKRVVDFLHAAAPVEDWLAKHVGPSTLPDDRWR